MTDNGYEPKIIGFLCNWCSYAGADLAGVFLIPQLPGEPDLFFHEQLFQLLLILEASLRGGAPGT